QRHAVLAPFRVLLLPRQDAGNAIAVADVNGRDAGHAGDRGLERADAPGLHLVEIDVEAGLVELDHVGAGRGERARLGVQHAGETHGQRFFVAAVVLVEGGVDHGHRAGEADLHGTARVRFREAFLQVSDDIVDAARVDGAGTFTIIFRVLAPIARARPWSPSPSSAWSTTGTTSSGRSS